MSCPLLAGAATTKAVPSCGRVLRLCGSGVTQLGSNDMKELNEGLREPQFLARFIVVSRRSFGFLLACGFPSAFDALSIALLCA